MTYVGTNKPSFLVNGHKVELTIDHRGQGVARFLRYNILVEVAPERFTYDWVLKVDYKLKGIGLLGDFPSRD